MLFYARCFMLFVLTTLLTLDAKAQELWGAANSNYAGNMGLELNPASLVGAPYRWEIHLLSADISAMNNYLYLKKNSRALRAFAAGNSVAADRVTYDNITSDKFAKDRKSTRLNSSHGHQSRMPSSA